MRRALVAFHALALGGMVAVAACFPDPPADTGIPDSGIFLSDGSTPPTGDSSTSGLTLSTQTIDFGLNECGGVAPPNQKLTLTNTSSGVVTYGLGIAGFGFSLVPTGDADDDEVATGTIAAGQSVDIPISAIGVSTFATAGGLIEGALEVVTDAPGQKLFVVDLRETAAGAELTMIPNMGASVADFGVVASGDVKNLDVSFRNNGNKPIDVTFDDVAAVPFTLETDDDAGVTFTVAPNSTKTLQATYTADDDVSLATQVIGFKTTGVICGGGETPTSVRLQGHSTFPGNIGITPGVLTFDVGGTGYVPCGKAAAAQAVTVSYPAASEAPPHNIIDAFVTGPFTVSPTANDSDAGSAIQILPGNSQVFTITPLTVNPPQSTSPDGVDGMLQITLDNDEQLTVQLSQTAQGAVLSFGQPSMSFGDVTVDTPRIQNIGIFNNGNAAVGLTLGITGSPYFTASPSSSFSVNTTFGEAAIVFLPIAANSANATLSLSPSGPVCSGPLAGIPLTGNGVTDAGTTPIVDAAGPIIDP